MEKEKKNTNKNSWNYFIILIWALCENHNEHFSNFLLNIIKITRTYNKIILKVSFQKTTFLSNSSCLQGTGLQKEHRTEPMNIKLLDDFCRLEQKNPKVFKDRLEILTMCMCGFFPVPAEFSWSFPMDINWPKSDLFL